MTATPPPTEPDTDDQDDATDEGRSSTDPAEGADDVPPGDDRSADRAR
ncbi:hypothetical protein [uncultured Sphingomonas sp.]